MKIAKVKINKTKEGNMTRYSYPKTYDSAVVEPVYYQEENTATEYCVATVPDNYTFSDGIVEINQTEADSLIDQWVDSNVTIVDSVLVEKGITRDDIKTTKKSQLANILNQ